MNATNNIMIAHVNEKSHAVQTIEEHSLGVATLAGKFATEISMTEWGKAIGELHDLGKYRDNFQRYIRKVSGLDPMTKWNGEDKTHAYIGAIIAYKLYGNISQLISLPIMGHHSGLDDYTNYNVKIRHLIPEEIRRTPEKRHLEFPEVFKKNLNRDDLSRAYNHIIRMLYSCLVDADFLDTESFVNDCSRECAGEIKDDTLLVKLCKYIDTLEENAEKTNVNSLRRKIRQICNESGTEKPGFYSLTVPTGMGKTLSSVLWALRHCKEYGKRRIIIAVPYTTIISQTAETLAKIFGRENVLEHHSAIDISNIQTKSLRHAYKLASENWDYPIIVTTNVQLFESLYSNKPSKCRKLHNLANSVLILDEVQMFPTAHLQPIIDVLQTYVKIFSTTVLFTTASLPALESNTIRLAGAVNKLKGIGCIREIVPSKWHLYDHLRRVDIEFDNSAITISELAQRLSKHKRVLCIVNTRNIAKTLYTELNSDDTTVHLSRLMCPAHIKNKISHIIETLRDTDKPIRVISTQLIEAGIDLDFPVVYRQMAGLDSILQAMGRCNRNGSLKRGEGHIFKFDEPQAPAINRASDSTSSLPQDSDWLSPEVMIQYFNHLYTRCDTFDKAQIRENLYKPASLNFETASQNFRLIDDFSQVVYVNYGDSPQLIDRLRYSGPNYELMKKLSQYAVALRNKDFIDFVKAGLIREIIEGIYYIEDPQQYDNEIGLRLDNHWIEEILTI